jgi:hypothetical protein
LALIGRLDAALNEPGNAAAKKFYVRVAELFCVFCRARQSFIICLCELPPAPV